MQVDLFVPCLVDQLLPHVAAQSVELLRRAGCKVRCPAGQTCCGQPAWSQGCREDAHALARRFARVFDGQDPIVVPSGSCAAMLRHFEELLGGEAAALASRVVELSRFLDGRYDPARTGARFPHRVGFHDGCHALRELGLREEPRRLLAAVPGLELVELGAAAECCGFGGAFSVDFGAVSAAMADRKLAEARGRVDYLVTTEPACLLQLEGRRQRTGRGVPVLHLAEILTSTGAST